MRTQRFWPAGNTLLAGTGEPIRPNCCILPSVSEANLSETLARARSLWAARIGIGFDLTPARDPLAVLEQLSEANAAIPLGHRPQRGNMATLALSHPAAAAFAGAKAAAADADRLYNFNISLAVASDAEWSAHAGHTLRVAARAAWAGGDPGLVFLDRIRAGTPYDYAAVARAHGPLSTVVPCGEQAMHPNETCTLAAINLNADAHWTRGALIDAPRFIETVGEAVHLLDATLDHLDFAGDAALEATTQTLRRVGLGVMGWADVVRDRLRVPYDHPAAQDLARQLGILYHTAAHGASKALGGRHLTVTCMQPTGGITLLTGNRGFGIEPAFEDAPQLSVAAHVNAVAAWQPYVDNAISKTINLPREATPRHVLAAYACARAAGLKLVSVYRTGSRENEPMASCREGACEL